MMIEILADEEGHIDWLETELRFDWQSESAPKLPAVADQSVRLASVCHPHQKPRGRGEWPKRQRVASSPFALPAAAGV